jgi:hypothetical protein
MQIMNRIELFYSNVLANLESINCELQPFYDANTEIIEQSEAKSENFAEFHTLLNDLIVEINQVKTKNELIEDFDLFDRFYDRYEFFVSNFSTFPIKSNLFFKYWINISKKLINIKEDSLNLIEVIDNSDFKLVELRETVIENHFINNDSFLNKNIIIYNYSDSLFDFIESNIHTSNEDLLLIWLSLLPSSIIEHSNQIVLIKIDTIPDLRKLKSILKIIVLKTGKLIKSLEHYSHVPKLPISHDLNFGESYNQFDSISNILNEYNNQKFLLDKYLKLYHIIENFMYKQKICEIQNKRLHSPLHIRDFQVIYDKFSKGELDVIKDFFKNVFEFNYNATTKYDVKLKNSWDNLETINSAIINEIDNLLESLRLTQKYNNVKGGARLESHFFAKLVYYIRNAIVHNKDSETHFESTYLPNSLKFILENFLIPNLEMIVFHLIINKNDLVWYNDSKLILYHD